jgi:hypothetical protein
MTEQASLREARAFLSTLWLFFLMNIIFRDIHQFLSPGYMDWVISGEMFGRKITDELLLFGGIAGQNVGVKQVEDSVWLVSFMTYDLAFFDHEKKKIEPIPDPFDEKVLPMCQE